MPNPNKIEVVDQLTKKIKDASGIYFTCYTGLNVMKVTELRKKFRDNGVDYFVSKKEYIKAIEFYQKIFTIKNLHKDLYNHARFQLALIVNE